MTRKSCAVGMRNAILRNYLNSLYWALYWAFTTGTILRTSGITDKSNMADGVPDGEFVERLRTFMFFKQAQAARRARRRLQQALLTHAIARRRLVILVCCLITILLTSTEASALRSYRRLHRNLK